MKRRWARDGNNFTNEDKYFVACEHECQSKADTEEALQFRTFCGQWREPNSSEEDKEDKEPQQTTRDESAGPIGPEIYRFLSI